MRSKGRAKPGRSPAIPKNLRHDCARIHRSRSPPVRTGRAPAHAVPLRRGHAHRSAAGVRARADRATRRATRIGARRPSCSRRNGSTRISRCRTKTTSTSCAWRSRLRPTPISAGARPRTAFGHFAAHYEGRSPPVRRAASIRWSPTLVRRRSTARSSMRSAARWQLVLRCGAGRICRGSIRAAAGPCPSSPRSTCRASSRS